VNNTTPAKVNLAYLLAFGAMLVERCNQHQIHPLVYGSLAVLFYTNDLEIFPNDIDFLISKSKFDSLIELVRSDQKLRHEETSYNSIKIFKNELKVSFDSIEDYLKDLDPNAIAGKIGGHTFNFIGKEALKEVYRRGVETIPVKRDSYIGKLQKLCN
jgi:hypothetical protein